MRFGIFGFCRTPYGHLAERVRQAEAMGFASAWVNDDLMVPDYADFEPWTVLGGSAVLTAVAVFALVRLGSELLPPADPRQFSMRVITKYSATDSSAGIGPNGWRLKS